MNSFAKDSKSPEYYIRLRLLHNKPAMAGLIVIMLAVVIALLGYLVMPDQTPDANDGAVQMQKQPPGFVATLLLMKKNVPTQKVNIFSRALHGQESAHTIVPIVDYKIDRLEIFATIFGKKDYVQKYNLLNAVLSFVPQQVKMECGEDGGAMVSYMTPQGQKVIVPYKDLVQKFSKENIQTRRYWLGTDKMGRDMLSRLLYGTRISLSIGFIAVLISIFLGTSLGSLAGFFGGKIDMFIMWFMSVIWSIPGIILVISISMVLQSRGVWVAFVAVGLTMWVEVARVIRGQVMEIKEKQFIEAARAFGAKNFRIVFLHILPNIAGPLIVIATANFAAAILLEAGLSFLGLGVQPPTPSWGVMIYEGFHAIGTKNSLHLILFPGLAICILVLSFNLLGNGLRDAYDPKTLVE